MFNPTPKQTPAQGGAAKRKEKRLAPSKGKEEKVTVEKLCAQLAELEAENENEARRKVKMNEEQGIFNLAPITEMAPYPPTMISSEKVSREMTGLFQRLLWLEGR